MQKPSTTREQTLRGVQVLRRLRDAGGTAGLSGERRAKIDALACDTLRNCLGLLGRAEERRRAQEILAWIVLVFDSVRACGLDAEVAMARACGTSLSAYAAPTLLWAIAQALGAAAAADAPSQASSTSLAVSSRGQDGTALEFRDPGSPKSLTHVCRFALLCHVCESCQHLGISVDSLAAAMASSADPLRAVLGKYSTCRAKTEPVIEKTSRFSSALGKVLQQLAYCSAERGALLCSPQNLARLLVPFAELGWLSRRQGDDGGSARCPWRVACSGVEATLEFLLQRADFLGIQGCDAASAFLKKTQDWPLGDHHFLLQVSALILRCSAEPIVDMASKLASLASRSGNDGGVDGATAVVSLAESSETDANDAVREHLKRLLALYWDCLQGTFKADRRRGAQAAKPTAHSLAAALALHAGGPSSASASSSFFINPASSTSSAYLPLRGSRRGRQGTHDGHALSNGGWINADGAALYLGPHEKAVMDVVTGMAFAIFRLHAQAQALDFRNGGKQRRLSRKTSKPRSRSSGAITHDPDADLLPSEDLRKAAEASFARIGASDVHWKTIWAIGSKQVFATDWSSSEFEVSAAVLRSAVVCAANGPSPIALRGMVAALRELARDDLTSVQQLLRQSQKYHPEVVASGEYTVAIYASRLVVRLVYLQGAEPTRVSSPSASSGGHTVSPSRQDGLAGQLASALLALVQRACSARAVYELPLDVVLAWVPAVALAMGSASEALANSARAALLEVLQSVAVRGFSRADDGVDDFGSATRGDRAPEERHRRNSVDADRETEMDAVTMRVVEVWHALYATGALPGWMNESFGDVCETDPWPLSEAYTKDLMLMITQHHKLADKAAPAWFKPLIAGRQLRSIGQTLEADLRSNLLPFRTFPGSFMHGSEQAALSLASELIVPRLGALSDAMDNFAVAWQTQHTVRRGAQDSLLRLAALQAGVPAPSAVATEDPAAAGALGTTVQALQGLAETFARFDCGRGRLSAAFYMHSAALLLREAGDAWEAGNAFATVANCVLGRPRDARGAVDKDDASDADFMTRDRLHLSIASAFLREAIASFAFIGAHPEAHRIKEILERVAGRLERPSAIPSPSLVPPDLQEAISYYFLVGRTTSGRPAHGGHWGHSSPRFRQVHPWARVALSTTLSLVRIVVSLRSPLDEFGKVETALVERLQRGTGLALAEGRLTWETREVWEASGTSTAQRARTEVEPALVPIGADREAQSKDAFFVRRLWPVRLRRKTVPMLRCPGEFVLLPSSLDTSPLNEAPSPLEAAGRGLLTGTGIFGETEPQARSSRIVLHTLEALTPLVGLSPCQASLLADDGPSVTELLRSSPFGDPLGPVAPPPDLRLADSIDYDEGFVDEDDADLNIAPPPYPPPGFEGDFDMGPPSSPPPSSRGSGRPGPDMSQVLQQLSGSKTNLRAAEARPPRKTPKGMMPRQDSYSSVITEMSEKLRDRRRIVDEATGEADLQDYEDADGSRDASGASDEENAAQNEVVAGDGDNQGEDEASLLVKPKDRESAVGESAKEANMRGVEVAEEEEEVRPPLPPKPAQLLRGGFDMADGKSEPAKQVSEPSRRESFSRSAIIGCGNPLLRNGDGADNTMPRWPQRPIGGARTEIGGVQLAEAQARVVEQIVADQVGSFDGTLVDRAGLKEVKVQVVGRVGAAADNAPTSPFSPSSSSSSSSPSSPGTMGGGEGSFSMPPIGPDGMPLPSPTKARRRPSLLATVLSGATMGSSRQRGESVGNGPSSGSASPILSGRKSAPSLDLSEEPRMRRVGSAASVNTNESHSLQVWMSKAGGGLMRRQSRSFKLIERFDLNQVQVSETTTPGVIKIISEDRAKRGENPLLFQTDQPANFVAVVQALRAHRT